MPKPKWMPKEQWEKAPGNEKALLQAAEWVSQREEGKNAGPFVTKLLGWIGLGPGFPWCAAFVSACYTSNSVQFGPSKNRGRVSSWAKFAKESHRLIHFSEVKRGDLFYWLNPDGTGHIGFVVRKEAAKFNTIEGNTNDAGSREGDGVYRRVRYDVPKMRYIRTS